MFKDMVFFNKAFEKFYFNFYISTVKLGQRELGMLGFFGLTKTEKCQKQAKKQGLITQIHRANPSDPTGKFLLYFSKSPDTVKEAVKLHHSKDSGWIEKNRKLGELYGYPKCCIDFFISPENKLRTTERREFEYLKETFSNSKSNRFPFPTNRFALNPFVLHVPCSFDCQKTIGLARNYIDIARKINSSITQQILENLKAAVLVTSDSALSIPDYKSKREKIIFKKEDFKKALLFEEKVRQYVLKLVSDKKNFNFYFSARVINRMKEDSWREILSPFEAKGKYEIPTVGQKDLKVILFI